MERVDKASFSIGRSLTDRRQIVYLENVIFLLDIVIVNELSQEVIIFELTCPWDRNIARGHSHKTEKYAPLVSDLSQRFIVSFYAIEVSARGQITKENRSRLKSFLLKCCSDPRAILKKVISIASKSALLSSYTIFSARKEPTWEDPPPLVVR